MAVLSIAIVRVMDWARWHWLNREALLPGARQAGATRYRVYRNLNDASQALIATDLPCQDALEDWRERFNAALCDQPGISLSEAYVWEPTGSDWIES